MRSSRAERIYAVLIGLTTLDILLQAVWAGVFLEHDGQRDSSTTWLDAHSAGANVAAVLAIASAVVAIGWLRHRRDVLIGTVTLALLVVLEHALGDLIHEKSKDTLTAIHVPLGVFLMAVAVWLPTRMRRTAPAS